MPGLKFSCIHSNEPLINKRSEWLSSPAGGKEKVDPTAAQHCVMGIWVPARYWEQRCSSPRIRDAPTLGAEISQHWDQGCPSPGSRDAPALGSEMLPVMGSPNLGTKLRMPDSSLETAPPAQVEAERLTWIPIIHALISPIPTSQ